MASKIISSAIIISAAIWFAVNWIMRFMEVKDYGFIAAMLIVYVWIVATGLIKIINNEKE